MRNVTKTRTLKKNNFMFYQLDNGNNYTKGVRVCVCKTPMFSVKLNVCICVSMSELKEDRLVLTYKCMRMYMCVSWHV